VSVVISLSQDEYDRYTQEPYLVEEMYEELQILAA
jgi:hypothetical protein